MICELLGPALALGTAALGELRPDVEDLAATVVSQTERGYRLAGVIVSGEPSAIAVAGFRIVQNLAWGRHLYLDDLVTRAAFRGQGHGYRLMEWLVEQAIHESCDTMHLDSGVGEHRYDAHGLYHAVGLRIAAHHFSGPVPAPGGGALPTRQVRTAGLSLRERSTDPVRPSAPT